MNKTYYIGLDVHKETTAIAHTHSLSRAKPTYYRECGGSTRAVERNLKKLARELGVKFTDLKVCYEAGPTGFLLARRLIQLGVRQQNRGEEVDLEIRRKVGTRLRYELVIVKTMMSTRF